MNDKTEIIDVRLPRDLVEKLCSKQLVKMLETAWLEAFSRGAEFGMELVAVTQAKNKAARKKKRRKSK